MNRKWKALLSAAACLLALASACAHALTTMEDAGYAYLGSELRARVTGQFKEQTLDIGRFAPADGGPIEYALDDRDRHIGVYLANNSAKYLGPIRKDTLSGSDANIVHWQAGGACPRPEAVDALHNLQRAYDYYHSELGWQPDVNGMPFEIVVITDVQKWKPAPDQPISDIMGNAQARFNVDSNFGWLVIGQGFLGDRIMSGSPEIMGHEFTHMILFQKGINKNNTAAQAIHEGYCDVMGICIGREDENWVFADDYFRTRRDLRRARVRRYSQLKLDSKDEHYNGTLIGHAACLMNLSDARRWLADNLFDEASLAQAAEAQGEALDLDSIGQLFYRSMDYLSSDPGFSQAGEALHLAAIALGGEGRLSEGQVRRVDAVLTALGLLDLHMLKQKQAFPDVPDHEQLLREHLEALVREHGVMSTEILYDTESRTNAELSGLLSAHIRDFDGDSQPELLVNGFRVLPGAKIAPGAPDELLLNMEMYEVLDGRVAQSAEKRLIMLGITEIMGRYGALASGFLYASGSETRIGFDTFYGVNEATTTVVTYRYDGVSFDFLGGTGNQEYGEGSLLARTADRECNWAWMTNCSDWWALMQDAEGLPHWNTVEKWDTEAHDWALPAMEDRRHFFGLYRDRLAQVGLTVARDLRIVPTEVSGDAWAEQYNGRFTQRLEDIYAGTPELEPMWRIDSRQLLGGPLELHREDCQGTLDAYRYTKLNLKLYKPIKVWYNGIGEER